MATEESKVVVTLPSWAQDEVADLVSDEVARLTERLDLARETGEARDYQDYLAERIDNLESLALSVSFAPKETEVRTVRLTNERVYTVQMALMDKMEVLHKAAHEHGCMDALDAKVLHDIAEVLCLLG